MLEFSESQENLLTSLNKVFVVQIYVGMLQRSLEQGGFDFWVGHLNAGGEPAAADPAFISSTEYRMVATLRK